VPALQRLVQKGATTCPHCKKAIFLADPGTNAVIGLVSFVVLFGILWTGTNWSAKVQTEQTYRDVQQMMKE